MRGVLLDVGPDHYARLEAGKVFTALMRHASRGRRRPRTPLQVLRTHSTLRRQTRPILLNPADFRDGTPRDLTCFNVATFLLDNLADLHHARDIRIVPLVCDKLRSGGL